MNRLLLADDSAITAKRFSRILEGEFEVDCASDLQTALRLLGGDDYQAFLLDYSGKGGMGLKLARIIRGMEIYEGVPILLLSSALTKRIEYAAQNSGVNKCLEKQISGDELKELILGQIDNPSHATVELSYFETKCLAWRDDNACFQYSPETGEMIAGVSAEDVSEKMTKRLRDCLSGAAGPRIFFDDIELVLYSVKL